MKVIFNLATEQTSKYSLPAAKPICFLNRVLITWLWEWPDKAVLAALPVLYAIAAAPSRTQRLQQGASSSSIKSDIGTG